MGEDSIKDMGVEEQVGDDDETSDSPLTSECK